MFHNFLAYLLSELITVMVIGFMGLVWKDWLLIIPIAGNFDDYAILIIFGV